MMFGKNNTEELDIELFRNPTAEYRGVPFWSWNCKVTKELINNQIPIFKKMGFGGVDIHPRTGMDITYLGDEYMELVAYTVQKCKESGMVCWLYDEDRFPSGAAGGIVTRNHRFRGRFLLLTENKRSESEGYLKDKTEFEEAVNSGKKPTGYYVTAYGIRFEDGCISSYRRLVTADEICKSEEIGEKIRYAYVKVMDEETWFQNQTYVDTMNPEAVAEFIRVTHETYQKHVGKEFGSTVPAIFTDEPRMGKHTQLSRALSEEDVTLPYTDFFSEKMLCKYGIAPLDIVPEYIWNLSDGKFSANRYYYRNMAAECFVGAFMDQIAQWCYEHNIAMTGHVLSEETLASQTYALGDCMRCYRRMDIPGIDILADRREFATVKQASSVARQNGKKGVVSELYGVTHWDCDFKTFKLQGDWQAALGVTVRVPHLSHMSLRGEAKRDWPGSLFFQAPWCEEYNYIEDYFSRMNTVLTRGSAIVNIGVIHPVESFWMYMGPDDQTADIRKEMDENFADVIKWLLYGTLDFDFLSEALLPEQCKSFLKMPDKKLKVGEMNYSVVIVPDMVTIRSTTLTVLEAFRKMGGNLIFMGRIPELVDGRKSERAYRLAAKCRHIRKERSKLYEVLEKDREVEIRKNSGVRSDNLIYQIRQDGKIKWLFICHVREKKQHISEQERYIVRIRGRYTVMQYDAQTGEVYPIESQTEAGETVIECNMYGEDSVLYRLEKRVMNDYACPKMKKTGVSSNTVVFETVEYLRQTVDFCRTEPNAVLLDCAQYRIDDGIVQEKEEILRLDNKIRKQLGFVIREGIMSQPYCFEEKETHRVTLYYHFESKVSVPVFLGIEEPEFCRIWLNGIEADRKITGYYIDPSISVISLPKLKKGDNELIVEVKYNQKTNLENMYVLGDFDVRLEGTHLVIAAAGKQGQLFCGDITRQGMPFYTGNLEYVFSFNVEEEKTEYYVHVPHFEAPLLAASVDEGEKVLIAYAPHRTKLGKLKKGVHELKLYVYGNRFNILGTLHNANDDFVWYGPDSFRTKEDDWTDCYRVRPAGIMSAVEIQKI